MNRYDDPAFFGAYAEMTRSRDGLAGAGEWWQMREWFPPLDGMQVLDLGCGYGWHCRYAMEHGAKSVLGIDQSGRMIAEAEARNALPGITYRVGDLIDYDYPREEFDLVISNLVLHYVSDLNDVYKKVYSTLKSGGSFLFNIEHPVFTAGVGQQFAPDGTWPVDDYYIPGKRETEFLGHRVIKEHHTLTQILMGLLQTGFR
ncbi:MAG: class I SAM-dependent methyltransferase, partial [Clostridia bacterium]|nr:class I SAM-dependent methyltransferase [Clostridia bacterium]